MKIHEPSEVLIVGGGFAGMYSAISAYENRCAVPQILCKSKTGGSGNSVVAMSVHRFPPKAPGLKEEYRGRFLQSGAGEQNPETVDFYIDYAADAVEKLKQYDFPLHYRSLEENGEKFPYLACCNPKRGQILTKAIRKYLDEQTGVACQDDVTVLDILCDGKKVCGTVALSKDGIEIYPAQAVILACGGAGNIYEATSNTSDVTGDGYAMALRCGLPLQGMEFVQFYPYRIYSPQQADIFPDIFEHGVVFRNEQGVRFMGSPEYPKKELENRDVVARAEFAQKEVWLDLSACDMDYLLKECPNIYEMQKKHPEEKLKVRPVAHFFMGGVPLRPDCGTEIEGLYVCGEVAGGLHGANRLAGSALSEAVLFGYTAGKNAAEYAKRNSAVSIPQAVIDKCLSDYPGLGKDSVKELRNRLRKVMWENVSVVRSEASVADAKAKIEEIRTEFLSCHPENYKSWSELRNMLLVAEQVIQAAEKRKESLGAHCIR